jgi:toxin HigB-1
MELSYKSKKLEISINTDKGLAKSYGTLAKKSKQRKLQLQSAESLYVIAQLLTLRLHEYQGNRKGTWSIDIYKNWRILHEIDHDPIPTLEDGGVDLKAVTIICIESIEDPH